MWILSCFSTLIFALGPVLFLGQIAFAPPPQTVIEGQAIVGAGLLMKVFRSRVIRAVEGSGSVRATIPAAVAAIIGAEHGTTLLWKLEPGATVVEVQAEGATKKRQRPRRGASGGN